MKDDVVLLKNVYSKIKSGELTEYKFKCWLSEYAYKWYSKAWDEIIEMERENELRDKK